MVCTQNEVDIAIIHQIKGLALWYIQLTIVFVFEHKSGLILAQISFFSQDLILLSMIHYKQEFLLQIVHHLSYRLYTRQLKQRAISQQTQF